MLQLLVLKIEDPGCFWVIIKGCSPFLDHDVDYQKLNSAMNDFYNSTCQDIEIKPLTLEEGQVCVVYCEELKCWCRAIVKSITSSADQYLAECFLVDFAKNIPVKSKNIRVVVESFMQLPYRAKKFSLYCTKPVTLHIDFCRDSTDIVPAKKWDNAAIQYFQNLLKATTQVEARLCAVEEDTFEVYLYVTIKDEKVCVNDDLVAKNYACYMSPTKNKNLDYLEKPRLNIKSAPSFNKLNPALTLWPMFLQGKDVQGMEDSHGVNFPAQSLQHTWCKGIVGDLRPTATAQDKAVKCNMDSLRDSPKDKSEKKHHCISLKDTNKRVESSVYWPAKRGITIYADPDVPEASALSQKSNEKPLRLTEKKEYDEKNSCVKLLQFLNPDPLRADGISDLQQLQKLKGLQPPVVVLRNKIKPCLTIDSSPLSADLKKALQRNKFPGPSHTESYSWPPIARGCDVVVISHCESNPLLYLLPVLTVLQTGACYKSLPSRNGPLAVIVCPGWKKAQFIFELLGEYSMSSRPLHPVLLTIGLHKEEAKNTKLPRGCDVIVTTPYSLLRLLACQSLLFLRLCHLILDEVEVLFLEANEQMFAILDNFKKNIEVEERESAPHQIVAVGVHWNKHIEHLIKEFMNDPYIVITAMEEAALYGNVQQVVHLCLECEKTSSLLQALDFIPSQAQKTLIFTCSVAETEIVCKVVESSSIFCLKMHKEMIFNLQNVLEQWKKKLSSGSQIILALTDDCVPLLAITDATCVIHFSFPASPKVFGGRLYCMSDHFHAEQGSPAEQGDKKAKSVLLLTEKDASHAVGVLRYLERADAKVPAELYEFTAGVLEAKEDKKAGRPLCPYLKAFGFCNHFIFRDKRICPDRHRINPETDLPRKLSSQALPSFGYIKIIPFYILNATNYFGRIVDKHMDLYATLNAEMNEYFKDSNKTTVEKVEKFGLYGLAEKTLFHRVQVLEVNQKEDAWALDDILVEFIDEGRTGLVTRDQLLHLPEHFHTLPPQAVEFIVCRVKPADNEIEWNPKVTRYIHHKIVGKLHDAKVILALGNTVWIDPMVHITNLSSLKTSVIDYNVRAEILSMGMGIDNPEHIEQLKKLREDAKIPACEESLSQTPPRVTGTSPAQDQDHPSEEQGGQGTPPAEDAACLQSPQPEDTGAEGGAESKTSSENQKPETLSGNTEGAFISRTAQPPLKSFHPQIKWFQKEDVVILKIRIRNVKDYKCQYLRDRVVFSAWVGDKFYLADLELRGNIRKDDCQCVIRNDEPVITLAKERREAWCHLLRQRNPNVAFDFDHWEDCEEDSHFPKVVNSKNLPYTVTEVVEDSSSTSEDDDSESEREGE
ncbi:tudor domain containing 12 [Homo sapiens]|uniref:Putative ATP-dependent RNA helicase TDRD12 n=2 Tax=Homo sapiens TaxID=9606 RepID=A0A2R8Y872_HUMAN|nr:putative ATP-dependent RNA helicase TDRD12 isoform X1 [Homo sapiens]XP_054178562.1 putative ATP-dependent RNA helicase TDRD12 isoform X1 [Homo sapiens]KAI2590151.1 tudor domain containing 12 [Homo sapiens]KAI4041816.1 tudor domain containing 12 [Homo sapiens]|eukprot:XP_011525773.1 putative ATP-dependent RNA helicase TDRD12 isoform X1 [Homo sapiens]